MLGNISQDQDNFGGGGLSGRVAVVTGASQGLGASIVTTLRSLGAEVVATDLHGDGIVECDAATEEGNQIAVDTALERHGRLDIVVLNAGVQHVAPIESFPIHEFDRLLAVMLRGPFLMMRQAWPHLIASRSGRIVVVSSPNSERAEPYKCAYNAAKAGVLGLVRTAAVEGGPHAITANAVGPGIMDTPLIRNQLDRYAGLDNVSPDELLNTWLTSHATPRFVKTQEVADTIAFLSGPTASAITGTYLPVDLGLSAK